MPLRRLRSPGAMPHGFRSLFAGSFWLILSAGLAQGSMLLANFIVANLLGVTDYGRFALLQTSLILLAVLAQTGFGLVIAQQVSSLRERDPAQAGEVAAFCFAITLLVSLAFLAGLILGREGLAETLYRDPALLTGILLVGLAFPPLALSYVQQGLLNGLERFRDQTRISLLLSPSVVLLPSLGAWRGGFEGALAGLGLAYLLRAAVMQLILARVLRKAGIGWSLRNLRARLDLLWRFAMPAALSGVIGYIAIWGGQTLLVRAPGGQPALGLFAAALTVKMMVLFVPAQMTGALLPVLSRFNARFADRSSRGLLLATLGASVAITTLLAGAGILFAPQIMGLFGADFGQGSFVLVILLLAAPLEAACINLSQAFLARGRFWALVLAEGLPKSIIVLAVAALLIPDRLAEGLAYAWLLGWAAGLAGTVLAMAWSRRAGPAESAR